MNLPERVAKAVIESALSGSEMSFRHLQSSREWDFDLRLADGSYATVEVTASADDSHLALLSAMFDERRGGQFVAAVKCRHAWYVRPTEDARIDRIRRRIDDYLWPIEEAGIRDFDSPAMADQNRDVDRIWTDLRIEAAAVIQWNVPRQIILAAPTRSRLLDCTQIVIALEREAQKADNIAKLEQSPSAERHLFVFVDSSNDAAWGAMVSALVPATVPALPDVITHAWMVSSSGRPGRFRTLLYERENGWRDLGHVDAYVEPNA